MVAPRPTTTLLGLLVIGSSLLAQQTWMEVGRAGRGTAFPALAFDEARAELVWFSGHNGDGLAFPCDTWVHDGSAWSRRNEMVANGFDGAGMVYDPVSRTLLRYGDISGQRSRDTMSWDGQTWRTLQSGGPLYDQSTLGYDRARNRAVLSVMKTLPTVFETWEWNGAGWQQITFNDAAFFTQMAFDPTRGKVLGLAGRDLHEWNGTAWTLIAPALLPVVPFLDFKMSYDTARSRLVVTDTTRNAAAVWEWDGTNLVTFTPATGPLARTNAAVAYDPVHRRTVLMGGVSHHAERNDTWEWDGTAWSEVSAGPPPGTLVHLAHDPARGRVVCYQQRSWQSFQFETWEWDGLRWLRQQPATVPPAYPLGLGHDVLRGRTVLLTSDPTLSSLGTWEWNGVNWSAMAPAAPPATRNAAAVAFDLARGELVLFGGASTTGTLADTWLYNGNTWRPANATVSPPARFSHAMAFDAQRQRVVLFGGASQFAVFGDTWEWDGSTWLQALPVISPSPRHGHAMAFDGTTSRVALTGGAIPAGTTQLFLPSEYWQWDGTIWTMMSAAPPERLVGSGMAFDGIGMLLQGGTRDAGFQSDPNGHRTWRASTQPASLQVPGAPNCSGSFGVPRLRNEWLPLVGNSGFALRLSSVPPRALAVFALSTQGAFQSIGNGCALYLQAPVTLFTLADAIGFARQSLPVPNIPLLTGLQLRAQGGALDAGAPGGNGFALSSWLGIGVGR